MNVFKPAEIEISREDYKDGGFVIYNGEGGNLGTVYRLEIVSRDIAAGNHLFRLINYDDPSFDEVLMTAEQMEMAGFTSITEPQTGYFENLPSEKGTLDDPTSVELLPVNCLGKTRTELGLLPNPTGRFLDSLQKALCVSRIIKDRIKIRVVDLTQYGLKIAPIDQNKMQ